MGNTNYSRNPSCAHLTVLWVSMQTTGGLTTGWWQCKDCGHRFYPAHPSWDSAPRPATPEGHRPELTYYEGIVKKVADIADEPTTPKELAVRLRELVLFGQTYDVRAATPEREPPPKCAECGILIGTRERIEGEVAHFRDAEGRMRVVHKWCQEEWADIYKGEEIRYFAETLPRYRLAFQEWRDGGEVGPPPPHPVRPHVPGYLSPRDLEREP